MTWHPEVLPPHAVLLAKRLSRVPRVKPFYLAGGTALALQRGHRISMDFDFFSSEDALGAAERERLKEALAAFQDFKVREETEGTLHAVIAGVETSFLRYRYPLVRKTLRWNGLRVASAADIGLMKIGAIIGRGSRKDFRDVREIARALPLKRLLALAPRKFPDAEDFLFQAAKALVYFEEAQGQPDPRLLRPEPWDRIKSWFEREVPGVFQDVSSISR